MGSEAMGRLERRMINLMALKGIHSRMLADKGSGNGETRQFSLQSG
jgi:hypothetical protein